MIIRSRLLDTINGIDHAFLNCQQSIDFAVNEMFISIEQVHGADIWIYDENLSRDEVKKIQSDAIICQVEKMPISIITADCIPLIIASCDAEIIAIVHAGWKGLSQDIIKKTIEKIQNLNIKKSELFCCIGPHIMPCCYEIQEDLIESINKSSYKQTDISSFIKINGSNAIFLDIANWCKHLLINEGISSLNIESIDHCTYCSAYGYGSYRRRAHYNEKKSFQYSWIKKIPQFK